MTLRELWAEEEVLRRRHNRPSTAVEPPRGESTAMSTSGSGVQGNPEQPREGSLDPDSIDPSFCSVELEDLGFEV
jgi:hypothetical protein